MNKWDVGSLVVEKSSRIVARVIGFDADALMTILRVVKLPVGYMGSRSIDGCISVSALNESKWDGIGEIYQPKVMA
jgi:hypothetical protein